MNVRRLVAATHWPVALLALAISAAAPAQAQRQAGPGRPTDFLDPGFHRARREALRQQMPAGSVAVLFAAPVRNRANDVDFIYHQSPDLYYLTGYDEPQAVLVLFKESQSIGGQAGVTEAMFVQPRNPKAESWTGRRLGTEGAKQQLKLQYVADNKEFATAAIPWSSFSQVLFTELPTDVRDDPRDPADLYNLIATFRQKSSIPADYSPDLAQAHQLIQKYGVQAASNLRPMLTNMASSQPQVAADAYVQAYLKAETDDARQKVMATRPAPSRYDGTTLNAALDELRAVKTPEELKLLRRAIRISTVGQQEVMKALRPDMAENEVQALHEYVYRRYGAEFEGYPSIVGAGANGCILHYETNDKPRIGNDLILMDCGAEYHGYSADVTRTAPPSGKFSPEQKQIYELVLAAQDAGIAACKPGAEFQAPDKAARKVVEDGLLKLGLIKTAAEARQYFPHGTSHYLGLDVHDRGSYGPLKAGNVITVEPGIYIPEGSPCDKKWWNIGVRIEDDILITPSGWENLSKDAPRTVAEVESLMAKPSPIDNYKLPELK
ncbi:aminopeptidase P family protein [Hymenobacter busanensis]|uniref:Xaa-Pro aminopeptidase n=1 Tax=Hymenobacter busanensis TaxID=2607656 RepID=A0A7L4ZZD8_9BACT|nr:aminopeptidase P family protein [Hymenobacter busanensis]KAA9333178.1 aminopeptidase P family protein [Hymenobacter busanensis]QHJ08145.1 M24 family metallopeptidase [Hymenobacter busanensis]